MTLLSVEDALARILALADPLPVEHAPLLEAAGRTLAEPVYARRTQPYADLSAMDGYAIRHADLPGPWHVIGESAAGRPFSGEVSAGQAARIFTGAPLPLGADTILIQESVARSGMHVAPTSARPARGAHIRPEGVEFRAGDLVGSSSGLLTPQRIALLAAAGHGTLPVRRRARVALISTGDELVLPGAPTPGAALPSSNAPMLAARLSRFPLIIDDLGIIGDDPALLNQAFRRLGQYDLLLTTGGVSVGDHDHVRRSLEAAGAKLDFWRVAIKPGKPLLAGNIGGTKVLGLPGNPVSALVTALLFVEPLLAALTGSEHLLPRPDSAALVDELPPTGGRAEYLRGRLTPDGLTAAPRQDSAGLAALANATALIVRPPHSEAARIGDSAVFLPLA